MQLNQVAVPSADVAASVRFYTTLGLQQIVRTETYARFVCPDGDATFSVEKVTEVGRGKAPVVFFECDDLDSRVSDLQDAGLVFESGPEDQPWLWRDGASIGPRRPRDLSVPRGREPVEPTLEAPLT